MPKTDKTAKTAKTATHTIIVFPDMETWNTIEMCTIVVVSDEDFNRLAEGEVKVRDIVDTTVAAIGLRDCTPY